MDDATASVLSATNSVFTPTNEYSAPSSSTEFETKIEGLKFRLFHVKANLQCLGFQLKDSCEIIFPIAQIVSRVAEAVSVNTAMLDRAKRKTLDFEPRDEMGALNLEEISAEVLKRMKLIYQT